MAPEEDKKKKPKEKKNNDICLLSCVVPSGGVGGGGFHKIVSFLVNEVPINTRKLFSCMIYCIQFTCEYIETISFDEPLHYDVALHSFSCFLTW